MEEEEVKEEFEDEEENEGAKRATSRCLDCSDTVKELPVTFAKTKILVTLEKLTHFVRESEERQFPWEQLLSYRKSAARCFSFENMECNNNFVSKEHIVVSKSVPEVCLPAAKKVPLLFFF